MKCIICKLIISNKFQWNRCLICGLKIDICKFCINNYIKFKLEEEIYDFETLNWIGKIKNSENLFCNICVLSGLYPDDKINSRNIRINKIKRI
jgi:hypothetical protein